MKWLVMVELCGEHSLQRRRGLLYLINRRITRWTNLSCILELRAKLAFFLYQAQMLEIKIRNFWNLKSRIERIFMPSGCFL